MHTCKQHTPDVSRRDRGRQMFCSTWLLLGLVLLAWSARGGDLQGEGGPGQLFIQLEEERLTVSAREISHRRLLEELARQLNFELILAGPLEQPCSLEIKGRPWKQALRTALAPASWAFIYESGTGRHRLIKVVVFPSQKTEETNTRWDGDTEATPYSTATATEQPQSPGQPVEQEVERYPEAAEAALHASDHEVRLTAIAHLGQQADHEALRVLLEIVEDPGLDSDVLQSAVAALETLVQRAEDREVQQLAAETLGIQFDPVTAEAASEPRLEDPGE